MSSEELDRCPRGCSLLGPSLGGKQRAGRKFRSARAVGQRRRRPAQGGVLIVRRCYREASAAADDQRRDRAAGVRVRATQPLSMAVCSSQEGARRVGASIRNRSVARRWWIGGRESGRAGAAFGSSAKNKEEGRASSEPLIRRRNVTDRQFRGSRRQPWERCGEVGCRARCM
jgi:hypothetical protein